MKILTKVKLKPEDLIGNIVQFYENFWVILELNENKETYSWMYIKNVYNIQILKKQNSGSTKITLQDIEYGSSRIYIL